MARPISDGSGAPGRGTTKPAPQPTRETLPDLDSGNDSDREFSGFGK